MLLTSSILLCVLSVTVETTTDGNTLLDAVFVIKDFEGSDSLTVTCPGTQNDEIDLLTSKSQTYLNFSMLVSFRPAFPCLVDLRCVDGIPLQCTYCGYNAKENQVFASISRQSPVGAYKCSYLKTNREKIYLIVEDTTTETDVYKITTITLSCILGCCLLGVLAVLVKRCRACQGSCNVKK